MGRLIRAQFANSSGTVSYSYDAIGRMLATTDMFGQALSYQYDRASLRTLMTFQDGKQQIYQYNAGNQLSWTGISGSAVGYGVGYDAFDRLATITRANSANSTIGHDNADRVTSFGHSFATTSRNVTWGFIFNPAGGIVSMSTTNTDFDYREQQSATENHTFNGLNQDAAIAALAMTCSAANAGYDCSGNLTNDSNRHFTYDIDNHLTALSGPASASYVYDPIGRLVQTTVNGTVTRFLYDGVNLVAEYDGLGAIQRRYMHTLGTDQPWVQFTGSAVGASNAKYLYGDYHGSIIALADNTGVVANADIYKYGTYGEPLDINNNLSFSGSRFRYTGQTVLPEASLYYYKARVYDPVFGRFLQTDPIGSKDDLDLYAYVKGDPINHTDPTGNVIDVPDQKDRATILNDINSQSKQQYKYNDKGQLVRNTDASANKHGSSYFSKQLDRAIAGKATIEVAISKGIDDPKGSRPEWTVREFGGGATRRDGSRSVVDGSTPTGLKDTRGRPLDVTPAQVLMHELVGHSIPETFGGGTGNAVDDENLVRRELGLPLRQREADHPEDPR